jgi:hypothetical protein
MYDRTSANTMSTLPEDGAEAPKHVGAFVINYIYMCVCVCVFFNVWYEI